MVDFTRGLANASTVALHLPFSSGDVINSTTYTFSWSPSSRRVLFYARTGVDFIQECFLFDRDNPSAGHQRIHAPLPASDSTSNPTMLGENFAMFLQSTRRQKTFAVDLSGPSPAAPVLLPPAGSATQTTGWFFSIFASPDRTQAVFRGEYGVPGARELWYVDFRNGMPAAGSAVRLHAPFTRDDQNVGRVQWSPDSQRVAYLSTEAAAGIEELYMVDVSGAAPSAPIGLNSGPVADFDWSPDGSGIAFTSQQLYWLPLPVGVPPGTPVQLSQTFNMPRQQVEDFLWVNDTRLVYFADPTIDLNEELFAVDTQQPGAFIQLSTFVPMVRPRTRYFPGRAAITPDRTRLVAIRSSSTLTELINEAQLFDPTQALPGVQLHPPVVGTGLGAAGVWLVQPTELP